MGHTTGAEATGGTIGTGTAKGDLNGYQIQLTAEEAIPAPFVDYYHGRKRHVPTLVRNSFLFGFRLKGRGRAQVLPFFILK